MSEKSEKKLIFVFNADSGGKWAGFKDSLRKTFKKSTYECNLCAVTYGFFGQKREWKSFVNNLEVPVEQMKKDKFSFVFLHKDEFYEKYNLEDAKFPSAYIDDGKELTIFISQDEMNSIKEIIDLEDLVNKRIEEFNLK
jgi:hypothetical protein